MTTKRPVGGMPKKTRPTTALAAALTGAKHLSSVTAGVHPGAGEACLLVFLLCLPNNQFSRDVTLL